MTLPIAFVDTETISLKRDHRHLWEVALIIPEGNEDGTDLERVWILDEVPLGEADAVALEIGRFHQRWKSGIWKDQVDEGFDVSGYSQATQVPPSYRPWRRAWVAREISQLTWGRHLIGAVPSFDELRLEQFVRFHGQCPNWHYHLIDIEALLVGYLKAQGETVELPWKSDMLARSVGIHPEQFEAGKHTALGDCRWVKAQWDAVMGSYASVASKPKRRAKAA